MRIPAEEILTSEDLIAGASALAQPLLQFCRANGIEAVFAATVYDPLTGDETHAVGVTGRRTVCMSLVDILEYKLSAEAVEDTADIPVD